MLGKHRSGWLPFKPSTTMPRGDNARRSDSQSAEDCQVKLPYMAGVCQSHTRKYRCQGNCYLFAHHWRVWRHLRAINIRIHPLLGHTTMGSSLNGIRAKSEQHPVHYSSPGFLYRRRALTRASLWKIMGCGYPSLSASEADGLCKSVPGRQTNAHKHG